MSRHVACHQARVDIGSARGWITDDEVDCLATVEFFHGLGEGRNGDKQSDREDTSEAPRVQSTVSGSSWFDNISDGRLIKIAGFLTGHFFASQLLDLTMLVQANYVPCTRYHL
jgi:hypothetical protein